ncbi:hypothetical protein K505DRAFT_340463 [Melanomma pulvis-pyrius CBS 109.77]|uniref:Uncharacterized protein n=1 Tax=Melanomma pulvis-pyrius CBS 109.77 TaxID=1314802 RepID=A0A6A6X244_9PLEO|nr:hypothetical protein K505DRAFT_340463 [Melanomma pulvis-pyrius CBS 109.77]
MAPSSQRPSDPKYDLPTTGLLSRSESYLPLEPPQRWAAQSRISPWVVAAIASLLFTNILTFTAGWSIGSGRKICRSLAEPPTGIARVLKGISTAIKSTTLNSTFHDPDDSVYRKHSSAEADEAWEKLAPTANEIIFVSKEDAKQSDIDPDRHAYWDNPDMGFLGYPVGIEVHHQLHCLDMIRKNLYYNIDFTREKLQKTCVTPKCVGSEEFRELHIDHCVDYLRNRLTCTADVGLVPLIWVGMDGETTVDMARIHSCRNFDAVLRYSKKNGIALPEEGIVKPKPGDFVLNEYL